MKNGFRSAALCVAPFAASLAAAQPAIAQIWIGQIAGDMAARAAHAQCMSGNPLPPDEILEARVPALAVMRSYWDRVSSADGADISSAFHQRGRADWGSAGSVHRRAQLRAIRDPLARQDGAAFNPEPAAFVRGADGHTARGVWLIGGAESWSPPLGYYLADFVRTGGVWKLRRIEVVTGAATPPEVTQYCSEPGDIERAKAAEAERQARREARRAAREAARASRR